MSSDYQANSYKNVMELLVDDEIDRQTVSYSRDEAHKINRIEVAAYALNRLPPLYASSQEGVEMQYSRGQQEFSDRIQQSVSQALGNVAQQPQRDTTPFNQPLTAPELQPLADRLQSQ
jgi:hypothetical protein